MVNVSTLNRVYSEAIAGSILVLILIIASANPVSAGNSSFFNGFVNPSSDLSAFHKWTRVISAEASEKMSLQRQQGWNHILASSQNSDRMQMLRAVNAMANQYDYIEDKDGWGSRDYWATPTQFFTKGGGDCEDYAIVKYMALRAMGWNPADMRIVILHDTRLNEMHAVLAVNLEGTTYLLDNQLQDIADATKVRHYRPIYSINEQAWWRYQPSA